MFKQLQIPISISVVIPTCGRKTALLTLLSSLQRSFQPMEEIIIVDSGDDPLQPEDWHPFTNLTVRYLRSEKSVCIQRNLGIRLARGNLIFLCDDDMEVPADYLQLLTAHITANPEAGAVSGMVLSRSPEGWQSSYPLRSPAALIRSFVFQLSIWGNIECKDGFLVKWIKQYYQRKGNHISKAGWPVITQLNGDFFISPIYGLGASLVRKDWLRNSPYEEVLDRNGIGDNYGVALGFPPPGIHILPKAFIYHHQLPTNRLPQALGYFRRVLALDYFIRTKKELRHIKRRWLLWSLTGHLLGALLGRNKGMIHAAFKSLRIVALGPNPYLRGFNNHQRIVEPEL